MDFMPPISGQFGMVSRRPWSTKASQELYQMNRWGAPYFSVNHHGHVQVTPRGEKGGRIDLYTLVQKLRLQEISTPYLIRFPDILGDRLERLHYCFQEAIASYGYGNIYRGVYPLKCNPQKAVVTDVLEFGHRYHFGLEVGSKPELMIAIAQLGSSPDLERLLVCNGYKDRLYIETALLASQLGHQVIIVVEQLSELSLLLEISDSLAIAPLIGVRAKLTKEGMGRWGTSTGDRAKFGLSIPQIMHVVNQLKESGRLNHLKLLHYHIGSQIPSIAVIKTAIREAAHIYTQLAKLGAPMGFLDVGGGLAVDYCGAKNTAPSSKNYNMQNYANDVVATIQETCLEARLEPPVIISESGRAIAAHQSLLICEMLSIDNVPPPISTPTVESEHLVLRNLKSTYESITPKNCQESYHDAVQFKTEASSLFNLGYLSLPERAQAEELYGACCHRISRFLQGQGQIPEDLEALKQAMAATCYVNMSIFQSIPDSWAIQQLFPVLPIHRLDEAPSEWGVLADLTCDSDGCLNRFIDSQGKPKDLLEFHSSNGRPYYLGFFLIGAYQENLGSRHNLFGTPPTVQVSLTDQGYSIDRIVPGETNLSMLSSAQYEKEELLQMLHTQVEQYEHLTAAQAKHLLAHYQESLRLHSYLEP